MKKLGFVFIALIFILILAGFAGLSWYQNAISQPAGEETEEVVIEVASGESIEQIADKLEAEGLLANKTAFVLYAKMNKDLVSGIQAGFFDIAPANTPKEIMQILQKSRTLDDIKVLVPPGLRADEITAILAGEFSELESSAFSAAEFANIVENPDLYSFSSTVQDFLNTTKPAGESLEGFLFPDTYFLAKDSTALTVVEKMIATLDSQVSDDDMAAVADSGYSFYEILNVAAMIEREALTPDEEPMIADVIYKRLEEGVEGVKLLQIDATLLYIAKDWKANAFLLKESDSPYNTYKFAGLPPTPIANPGFGAIEAAIYPESNDYFYYIHDNSGQIHYGRNLSEHESNVAKYL